MGDWGYMGWVDLLARVHHRVGCHNLNWGLESHWEVSDLDRKPFLHNSFYILFIQHVAELRFFCQPERYLHHHNTLTPISQSINHKNLGLLGTLK